MVEVTVKLPDKLALAFGGTPHVRERLGLEHIAIEEYLPGRLSQRQLGDLLGLDYWQTRGFLPYSKLPRHSWLSALHA